MKKIILLIMLISSFATTTSSWAGSKLFIGNLPFATTSAEVNDLVMDLGTVRSVKVKSIDNNGDMYAKAVVEFASEGDTDNATAALDRFIYMGKPLTASKKEILVVGSKVKEVIREAGLRSDGDLVQAVSDQVHKILGAAIQRAKANKRGTVRPYDL